MTIPKIDRTSIKLIGTRAAEALKELGDELGITFDFQGAGTYGTGETGEIRLSIAVVTAKGAISAQVADFQRYATTWRLDPADLGKRVNLNGRLYEITGANPSARKNPINIRRVSDGTMMKCSPEMVRTGLEITAKAEADAEARRKAAEAARVAPPSAPVRREDIAEEEFVAPVRKGVPSSAPTFNSGSPFV